MFSHRLSNNHFCLLLLTSCRLLLGVPTWVSWDPEGQPAVGRHLGQPSKVRRQEIDLALGGIVALEEAE